VLSSEAIDSTRKTSLAIKNAVFPFEELKLDIFVKLLLNNLKKNTQYIPYKFPPIRTEMTSCHMPFQYAFTELSLNHIVRILSLSQRALRSKIL
jgi:hypothetical protein